jgi:adenosylcobinamide-phosphate synthase
MAFFSVLAAVALEHVRPLRQPLPHYRAYSRAIRELESKLDGGEYSHGALAWSLALIPLLLGVWLIAWILAGIHPILEWAWNIGVLYFTLGFKYYSDDAVAIARLLRAGDLSAARSRLALWLGGRRDADAELSSDDLIRVTIEQIFSASLRQMFGVLFWFVVLSAAGPVGAVLYRASSILARRWNEGSFGQFARAAFHLINWLPARLTALTYAIAGDFEDAMYCWRTQASSWPDHEAGIVLAAGAGAMGVRLGMPLSVGSQLRDRPELGLNQTPELDHIDSAVSMVWRGLSIWLVVGILLVIAGWAAA